MKNNISVLESKTPITLTLVIILAYVLGPVLLVQIGLVLSYKLYSWALLSIYAMVLMGLNLVTGYSGQISLGQGAFYAAGVYTSVALLPYLGDYYLLVFPISGMIGLVLGYLIARAGSSFEGPFLALVTFALAVSAPGVISAFETVTGGPAGIAIEPVTIPEWIGASQDQWVYLMASILAVLLFFIANNLIKSEFGRALIALRDNPIAASTMGIEVSKFKTMAFSLSVMFAMIAGSLLPMLALYVAPLSFNFFESIYFLAAIIVGGAASRMGPIYAAFYMIYLPQVAVSISLGAPAVISGLLIILIILLSPGGIDGIVRTIISYLKNIFYKK